MIGELAGGWGRAPTDSLKDMLKDYYDKVDECITWFDVSKRVLKLAIIETMRNHIKSNSNLETLFERSLVEPIIKGEEVSVPWLQTKQYEIYKEIQKKLNPDDDINVFLKLLIDKANNELPLQKLRDKHDGIIRYAKEFKKAIDAEQQRLQQILEDLEYQSLLAKVKWKEARPPKEFFRGYVE